MCVRISHILNSINAKEVLGKGKWSCLIFFFLPITILITRFYLCHSLLNHSVLHTERSSSSVIPGDCGESVCY